MCHILCKGTKYYRVKPTRQYFRNRSITDLLRYILIQRQIMFHHYSFFFNEKCKNVNHSPCSPFSTFSFMNDRFHKTQPLLLIFYHIDHYSSIYQIFLTTFFISLRKSEFFIKGHLSFTSYVMLLISNHAVVMVKFFTYP